MIRLFALLLSAFFLPVTGGAQSEKYNFDESKVPNYKLPDPLVTLDGRRVTNARMWSEVRRPEILNLFETQVYGKTPAALKSMRFEVESVEKGALGGMSVRKQVTGLFNGRQDGPKMSILIYLPAARNKAAPIFAALNFEGNHTIYHGKRHALSIVPFTDARAYEVAISSVGPPSLSIGQEDFQGLEA